MERVRSKVSRLWSFSAVELLWLKEKRESSSTRMGGSVVKHVYIQQHTDIIMYTVYVGTLLAVSQIV